MANLGLLLCGKDTRNSAADEWLSLDSINGEMDIDGKRDNTLLNTFNKNERLNGLDSLVTVQNHNLCITHQLTCSLQLHPDRPLFMSEHTLIATVYRPSLPPRL